jgi:Uri superfamily endonuclease
LPAGRYLYCGSDKGPGGLKARLSRHFRHGKSVRWHVDQLTERGSVVAVGFSPAVAIRIEHHKNKTLV